MSTAMSRAESKDRLTSTRSWMMSRRMRAGGWAQTLPDMTPRCWPTQETNREGSQALRERRKLVCFSKRLLGDMREIVYEGYRNGRPTTAILKEIQRTYSTNKKHARLIARDQMAKLNADLTQRQQTDAGVEEYEWSDSRDSRVRTRHRHLNGKTFRWDDPPVVDTKTGRRCHPGQDFQCRCIALPVFNISTLNIPANPKK